MLQITAFAQNHHSGRLGLPPDPPPAPGWWQTRFFRATRQIGQVQPALTTWPPSQTCLSSGLPPRPQHKKATQCRAMAHRLPLRSNQIGQNRQTLPAPWSNTTAGLSPLPLCKNIAGSLRGSAPHQRRQPQPQTCPKTKDLRRQPLNMVRNPVVDQTNMPPSLSSPASSNRRSKSGIVM